MRLYLIYASQITSFVVNAADRLAKADFETYAASDNVNLFLDGGFSLIKSDISLMKVGFHEYTQTSAAYDTRFHTN